MKLNECEVISKLKNVPLLIVVGDSDSIVNLEEARQIYASASKPKELQVIDSANHAFEGKEDQVIENTVKWLRRQA